MHKNFNFYNLFIMYLSTLISISTSLFLILCISLYVHHKNKKNKQEETKIKERINKITSLQKEITLKTFFELRKNYFKLHKPNYIGQKGVYVIYNKTKDMFYVGQSKNLWKRLNDHFTGKGNGDIYADYKYGNKFTIKMILLCKSSYRDINKLEHDTISNYYGKSYNKNKGINKYHL